MIIRNRTTKITRSIVLHDDYREFDKQIPYSVYENLWWFLWIIKIIIPIKQYDGDYVMPKAIIKITQQYRW